MPASKKRTVILPEFPDTIDILGTIWRIKIVKYDDDPFIQNHDANGYCCDPEKLIVVCDTLSYPDAENESQEYITNTMKQTLRHELVHAFLYECGLGSDALVCRSPWPKNEEMVDWIARNGQKIYKTWEQAGCLYATNPETWITHEKAKKEATK